jgi:integrase/recombinase XerD
MRLSDALEGYLLDVASRGYSPRTIESNRYYLRLFARYLDDKQTEEITSDDLKRFVVHMQQEYKPIRPNGDTKPLGPAAMENVIKAVRSFSAWAENELKITRKDQCLRYPKHAPPEIETFTEDEMKRIMRVCMQAGKRKRKTGIRETLIVMLLIDTGIRLGELARLQMRDLNIETGELVVRPFRASVKSRPRTIPIGASAKRAAWRYLRTRADVRPDDPLFVTSTGHAVSDSHIQNMLHDIGVRAGVHANPHKFRHTFAIEYLRNGGDIFTLKRLLGHATLEMVEYYLTILKSDLESAHRRASPADHWKL